MAASAASSPASNPAVSDRIAPLPSTPTARRSVQVQTLDKGGFPVHFWPVDSTEFSIAPVGDGQGDAMVFMGRFCVWFDLPDEENDCIRKLELHADNILVFLEAADPNAGLWFKQLDSILPSELIQGIYLAGDVILAEGSRSIQADELYYDMQHSQALAVNALLRSFDANRGIPIYVKAKKLRQESEDVFSADDTVITTSEFYTPQISLTAAKVIVRDQTPVDTESGNLSDSSYQLEMQDVRFKTYNTTLLALPKVKGNMQQPDMPLRELQVGSDSLWGTAVESEWDLPKLLGMSQSPGTDSRLGVDYYSKRGPGVGIDVDYQRKNSFGRSISYFVYDEGEDRLGRHSSRRDLVPLHQERGRFSWQHRQFLPYDWQVSTEISYLSDQNFLEQYYRGEAQAGKEQETLIHSKRIQDNWGVSLLAKSRINHHMSQLEELPSAEFHWTGQSLFNDRFTLHSNTFVGNMRNRYGSNVTPLGVESPYVFAASRNELDLPLAWKQWRFVPYMAGTVGYDDGDGFQSDVYGNSVSPVSHVLIGEAGLRLTAPSMWRVDKQVYSRYWDLHQMRHVVTPRLLAVGYVQDKSAAKQRNAVQFGLSQRWQTKRGPAGRQRTVDWIRWNTDITWVDHSSETGGNTNKLQWNTPMTPLIDRFSYTTPGSGRRMNNSYGPNRSYLGMDFAWAASDALTLLADGYYDIMGGRIRRVNAGLSRVCWPDLSAYLGVRYMRDTNNNLGDVGSNIFTFAATYRIDPRYALVLSNQYDFEYGENLRSDLALVRRYHRLNYALTFGMDQTLDRTSLVFSLWPQGMSELALGLSRYMGLGL